MLKLTLIAAAHIQFCQTRIPILCAIFEFNVSFTDLKVDHFIVDYGLIHVTTNVLAEVLFSYERFESDMLAFSGCYYGGGEKERLELGKIRKRWKTLHVSHYLLQ